LSAAPSSAAPFSAAPSSAGLSSAAPFSAAPSSAGLSPTALSPAPQSVPPNLWHGTAPVPAVSIDTQRFVDHLLAQLTLEEKVGQMIQADIASISPADLRRFKLGSILAGGNAAPGNDIRSGPQAWLELTDEFHAAAMAAPDRSHPPIPILFGIDAVHGHAKVRGATIFPHNVALGATHDPDLVRRIGEATAAEVAATGIDWTFAPTVAVARDVRWGRAYESYSESPALVARYAPAMVAGLQGQWGSAQFMAPGRTLATVKHFVGDGGTGAGRDQGDTVTAEAVLADVHAAGYAPAISAGALIVMASYSSWNGVKMHANHYLLTDVLKGRMGFEGFVVGDWNAQEQIPGCTKSRCAAAILAGVDMLMAPDSWRELYENTLAEVRSGEIPQARIDDAVRRILRAKAIAGIFDRPAPSRQAAAGHFEELGSAAHRAVAREAVRKSLVLLKNAHGTLPLSPRVHVLVAGAAADDIGIQCGGWTVDWQGDHNVNADFPGATSIYGGISAAVARAGGVAELSRDGEFTAKPDAAIVVFGETPYAEFEGDRETLEFSAGDKTALTLLRRLRALNIPTVSIFLSGRPLWVNPEINASDAFVAAWLPGSEGAGIADVLFRGSDGSVPYDFTGRLAFSWPDSAMPVRFGAGPVRGAVYANGFGLDYHSHDAAGPVSEEARIAPRFRAPAGSLFSAGHPTAPWSLFVADGGDQVHVTTARQASPHGAVDVTLVPAGVVVSWRGTQDGMLLINGRAADFRPLPGRPKPGGRQPGEPESRGPQRDGAQPRGPAQGVTQPRGPAQGVTQPGGLEPRGPAQGVTQPGGLEPRGQTIALRYRVDRRPEGSVALGMQCSDPGCAPGGAGMLDVTKTFQSAKVGAWRELVIPVSCIQAAGTDLARVDVPFAVAASQPFGMTIAEVRVNASEPAPHGACPPAVRGVK
jgi:beta-glucosidase